MAPTLVNTYAKTAANPQVLSFAGKAGIRELFVMFISAATPTLPSGWVEDGSFAMSGGASVTKLWHLPAPSNTAGVTQLSIPLSASRPLAAIAWEDDLNTTPALYFNLLDQLPTGSTPALWGTNLHTFAVRDQAYAVYLRLESAVDTSAFDLVSYDNGFTEFGDSGSAGTGSDAVRLWIARKPATAEAGDGVTATANIARPSFPGAAGMFAYNEGPPLPTTPVLGRTRATLSFAFELGATTPPSQTVSVTNQGGGGTVAWTQTDDAPWLTVTPASGTAPSTITAAINTTGLAVGSYDATITITADPPPLLTSGTILTSSTVLLGSVGASPQTVTVNLVVTPQPLAAVASDIVQRYRAHNGAWRRMLEVPDGCTTPEAHGAHGNCVLLTDTAMTVSQPDVTSASADFKSSDVGKWMTVTGAGLLAQGSSLTGQIASVSSGTHAVLNVNAASTVSNVTATYGTDDTQAWKEALQALVTDGIENGTYAGKLLVPPKQYMIAGATTKGGATLGNSQIPMPYVNSLDQQFALGILGLADASGFYHWRQKKPAASGATLRTVLLGQALDATWGAPSVLGGPTASTPEPDATAFFSNMLVNIDGLKIIAPRFPSLMGIDLGRVGQANIGTLAINADALVGAASGRNLIPPNNDLGMALRMPRFQNNDNTNIFSYGCEGFFYGIQISDHTTAQRLALIYCDTAIYCAPGGGPEHGAHLGYVSCEACNTGIECAGGAGGKYPVIINRFDVEVAGGGFTIKDDNDSLTGEIHYAHNGSVAPSIKPKAGGAPGAQNIRIIDDNRYRGSVTSPSIPATATDFYNPFFRDAAVYVTGGTVTQVQVAGVTVPGTSGMFIVPTGKQVRLTYTVAPSWTWTLF
jgi:hypothetical protein